MRITLRQMVACFTVALAVTLGAIGLVQWTSVSRVCGGGYWHQGYAGMDGLMLERTYKLDAENGD